MRFLTIAALVVLAGLQYTYWFGQSGYFRVADLETQVAQQSRRNDVLKERNRVLFAEVEAFRHRKLEAVEVRARTDLGMVAANETFYFVDDVARPPAAAGR